MQSITEKDGLVGNIVNDLTFDEDGNLWVLTNKGLNKYNGSEWEFWDSMHGVKLTSTSRYFLSVRQDTISIVSKSTLYKMDQFDIIKYDYQDFELESTLKYFNVKKYDEYDFISYIFEGIVKYYYKNTSVVLDSLQRTPSSLSLINEDLCFVYDDSYELLNDNKRTNVYVSEIKEKIGLETGNLLHVEQDDYSKNILILFFEKMVVRIDYYDNKLISYQLLDLITTSSSRSYSHDDKVVMYYGGNGLKVLLLKGQLFYSIRNGSFKKIYSIDEDVDSWARSVVLTKDNSVFIGTGRGIKVIKNLSLEFLQNENIHTNEVSVISENNEKYFFAGHNIVYELSKDLSNVKELFVSENNSRYLTSFRDESKIQFVNDKEGFLSIIDKDIYKIYKKYKDRIYYNDAFVKNGITYTAGMNADIDRNKNKSFLLTIDKEFNESVRFQELDNVGYIRRIKPFDNKIYLVSSSGLHEIDIKSKLIVRKVINYNLYDIMPFEDKFLISADNAIYLYKPETAEFDKVELFNEPPATSYYTSIKDQFGRYWFGTNRGVLMIDFEEGTQRWYDESDGLLGSEVNRGAFMEASNGDILIGTDKGLNVYRYEFDPAISKAPEVEFYKTIINDAVIELDSLALTEGIKVESNDLLRLRFRLKDLYFDDSAIFRYRILKNGSASPWENLSASDDRSISLYYPTAAEYQIELQAKQKNSLWSAPTFSPKITVSTGIKRDSVLFYLLGTLGLIVAILLIQKARKH